MSDKKIILVPVTSNFFSRNFLQTDAFKIIKSVQGIELVLLVNKNRFDYYQDKFAHPNVKFDILPEVEGFWTERLFKFLEYESIHTRHVKIRHYKYLKRKSPSALSFLRKILTFCLSRLVWHIGYLRFWRRLIRKIYFLLPSSAFFTVFKHWQPDLVFCPTLLFGENLLLKEAKKMGIKSVGMVLSWDNLYTKSFLRVHPDFLIVQTDLIAGQSVALGDYSKDKIKVVGIPQYDGYFKREGLINRDNFFKKISADPAKKLILYAFSGKDGLAIDLEMLKILHQAISQEKIEEKVEVLIRPYPKLDFSQSHLDQWRQEFGFLGQPATTHIGTGKNKWEFDEEAIGFLTNSLAHADIIVNLHSTFFIEGAIFDKPLIGVAFDGQLQLDYWHSAARFFEWWDHLAEIKPLNGIWLVKNKKELVEAINRYLKEPNYLSEGRKKIVNQQCQFTDGNSGARLAKEILNLL